MRLLSSLYNRRTPAPISVICDGDSITAGVTNPGGYHYSELVRAYLPAGFGVTSNVAVSGQTFADMLSHIASTIGAQVTAAHAAGQIAIASGFAGTNDIALNGATATSTWAAAQAYFAACKAAGADLCLGWTILPRTGGITTGSAANFDAQRRTFNLHMLSSYASIGVDMVCDVAPEPAFVTTTNTYFYVDQIHPTVPGQYVLTQRLAALLLEYIGQHRCRLVSADTSSGPVAGGTTVNLSGSGFLGTTAVTVNGLAAAYQVLNDGQIRLTTAPGQVTGVGDLSVMGGQGASRLVGAWTYS